MNTYPICFLSLFILNIDAILEIPALGSLLAPSVTKIITISVGSIGWYYRDEIEKNIQENCYFGVRVPDYSKLDQEIFGQDLALLVVPDMFRNHVSNSSPKRALLFYFHGWSGTGKNHLTTLLLNKIYPQYAKNRRSKFVHTFTGSHYNGESYSEFMKNSKEIIDNKLRTCSSSVFIFDEIDNYPNKFLDFLFAYVDSPGNDDISYNKAIFVLLGNSHGKEINTLFHQKTTKDGLRRKDLSYEDFEDDIRVSINEHGPLAGSRLLRGGAIQLIVPFLPLTREHVRLCVISAFKHSGFDNPEIYPGPTIIEKITKRQHYFQDNLYSSEGCRNIDSMVEKEILLLKRKSKDEL